MNQEKAYRVGLVGAGYISEFHIKALKRVPNAQIMGIVDVDVSRAQAVASRFGLPAVYHSLGEMAAKGLDVVHVLTPPDSHAALTVEALGYGCHVLLEKPATTDPDDCDRIALAAKAAGKVVCVDHALLRDYFILKAVDYVKSGAIGDVVGVDYIRAQDTPPYRGGPLPPQYREGGYPFRDLGIHALYLMETFLGQIEDASAKFWSRGSDPNLMFDEWRVLVKGQKGLGQIQLSWAIRPYQHLLSVQGTRGILRVDLFGLSMTTRGTSRLPSHLGHTFSAFREGAMACTRVPANIARVLSGRIMRYHGLTKLVEEFYANLTAGLPTPVPVSAVKPVIEWTERLAREADLSKERVLVQFPKILSAPVLLTGSNGFIGGHVMKRLLQVHDRIRVFVRRAPSQQVMQNPKIEVVVGDLGDPAAVERAVAGCEKVYHVGAAIKGRPWDFDRGSVFGTQNIVDSCIKHGVKKLVYISSMSVIHAAKEGDPIDERWPLEPAANRRGKYTQTKLDAEKIVTAAVKERGLNAVILRPGLVFGPGSPLLSGSVGMRKGKRLIIFGNGKTLLPYVHVDDLVDAIMAAGEKPVPPGSIYHIVDPTRITQNQYAQRYIRHVGGGVKVVHFPKAILYSLALAGSMVFKLLRRPSPVSIYRFKSALASHEYDCSAAERELDWTPRTGTERGLATLFGEQAEVKSRAVEAGPGIAGEGGVAVA